MLTFEIRIFGSAQAIYLQINRRRWHIKRSGAFFSERARHVVYRPVPVLRHWGWRWRRLENG